MGSNWLKSFLDSNGVTTSKDPKDYKSSSDAEFERNIKGTVVPEATVYSKRPQTKKVVASKDPKKETMLPEVTIKGNRPKTQEKKVIASKDPKKETMLPGVTITANRSKPQDSKKVVPSKDPAKTTVGEGVTVYGKRPDSSKKSTPSSTAKPVIPIATKTAPKRVEAVASKDEGKKAPAAPVAKQAYKNPDGMSIDKVKEMQTKMGVDNDGKWGIKTQAAFDKYKSTNNNQPLMSMIPRQATVPSNGADSASLSPMNTNRFAVKPNPPSVDYEMQELISRRLKGGKIVINQMLSKWKK